MRVLYRLHIILLLAVCVFVLSHSGNANAAGDFNLSNRFTVEIDGVLIKATNLTGAFENLTEVVEYKDGEDGTMHTRPGNHKPGKMTVTKDWSNTSEWYKWRKAVLDGKVDRRSISVIFHNDAGNEVGRLNLYNCWPSGWSLNSSIDSSAPNSRNSGHANEVLEISYETFELKL